MNPFQYRTFRSGPILIQGFCVRTHFDLGILVTNPFRYRHFWSGPNLIQEFWVRIHFYPGLLGPALLCPALCFPVMVSSRTSHAVLQEPKVRRELKETYETKGLESKVQKHLSQESKNQNQISS